MCVSVLECIHEYMCLQRPKEAMGFAGARAGRSNIGCELCGCLGTKLRSPLRAVCALSHNSSFIFSTHTVQHPNPGNGPAYRGYGFKSISAIKTNPYRQAHRPAKSRQPLLGDSKSCQVDN